MKIDANRNENVVIRSTGYTSIATSAVVIILLLVIAFGAYSNKNFEWPTVGKYFFSEAILSGLLVTVELTVIALVFGFALGVPLAIMRQSRNPLLKSVSFGYVWFFRGTPLLVQLIFWFNAALLIPTIQIGLPFGPTLLSRPTNDLVTPLVAAILALGFNQAAYTAEIVRSGLISVDQGQTEAAVAIGMNRTQTLFRIVLPQAMRVIVPPLASETINMLKATSLVSVIALSDLLYSVQAIYQANYQVVPLLIVASLWYLIVVSVLSVGQHYLEQHFSRGHKSLTAEGDKETVQLSN